MERKRNDEDVEKEKKNVNIELLKIQIADDYFQTKISALYSYSFGAFGVVLLIFYFYFRHTMSNSINNLNDKCLTYVGELLDKVERGEPLPSITELKQILKVK